MSVTAPNPVRRRPPRVTLAAVALATCGLLVLTGCSSNSSSSSAAPQGAPSSQQGGTAGGFGGAGGNFVTGLIADVSGKTLQVQGTGSQTAVTYTSTTRFSEQTKVAASALRAGSCVMVQSSGAAAGATTVKATNVTVTRAVKGACSRGGFGGFGGARGSGRPSGMPSGAPSGAPQGDASGAPQGGRTRGANGAGRGVFGKVTSVGGSGFTVASTAFGTTKSQTYTVSTSSATTFTEEKSAKASAVKVGKCATAAGKTDSTGAVTATTIALRPAVNGACSYGLRRPSGRASNG